MQTISLIGTIPSIATIYVYRYLFSLHLNDGINANKYL